MKSNFMTMMADSWARTMEENEALDRAGKCGWQSGFRKPRCGKEAVVYIEGGDPRCKEHWEELRLEAAEKARLVRSAKKSYGASKRAFDRRLLKEFR